MPASTSSGPLGKFEKFLLILGSALIVLACYLFSLLAILLLLVVILAELLLFIILLRFGLAGFLLRFLQRDIALVGLLARNLWLGKGVDYQVALAREDAPALFTMLDSLASRLQVAPPHRIMVEMNCGAWVRLPGYRTGHGRSILGIGYDLLAALNLSEFQAVMAHEMTHAKLVKRGLKSWLNRGLIRIARMSRALEECVEAHRAQNKGFALASFLHTCSDQMTRLTARLVSAFSRQDEFEADHGAAELCGASPLRTSLLRLEATAPLLDRLPWSERVGRLETEASFSQWLRQELQVEDADLQHAIHEEARDPYSTHPPLHDRVAALPPDSGAPQDTTPALSLLAHPDQVAAALIEEIHRILAVEEEKDDKLMAKTAKRIEGHRELNWAHLPGLACGVISVVSLLVYCFDLTNWGLLAFGLVLGAASYGFFKIVRYRDRHALPVPPFSEFLKGWQAPFPADLQEREKRYEAELVNTAFPQMKTRLEFLIEETGRALGDGDYLRAHVSTRLALRIDNKNVTAALGNAIASAYLGMHEQAGRNLYFVRRKAGLSTPTTIWGAAWLFLLCRDWQNAEAFLWRALQASPKQPTFLLLLAIAQKHRGKFQSAVRHAEQALAITPDDVEAHKVLCRFLLDAGRLREAAEHLGTLHEAARTDAELNALVIRLKLLQKDLAAAQEWAAHFHGETPAAPALIELGEMFEHARQDQVASEYYERATGLGFFPEAQLGLARLASRRKDLPGARKLLLSSINLETPPPLGAQGPAQVFHSVINHLMQLDRARALCRAWIVDLPNKEPSFIPAALRGTRMIVFGATRPDAVSYLDEIFRAMLPSAPPADLATLRWSEAPKNQQPERPVFPGIQGFV